MRTAILGGTFDPIHIGHLHAGEVAMTQARLDRVLFMPAGDPWQKADERVTPAEHRLEMTRLAIGDAEGFAVDDREVTRDGPTYTAETLDTFPGDEDLFLILGSDAALGIQSWQRWEDVLARATILIVPRPGVPNVSVQTVAPKAVFLEMATLEVSSTAIREMAGTGARYRYLVTEPVFDYIEEHDLYADVVRER